jgi:radical SAM-linked protein
MRLRISFAKSGALRYTGHLDLQTIWERTIRRANLPLAYSHGFHPSPKIQIASALPLGFAGRDELADVWLETDPGDLDEVHKRLQTGSPPGLTVLSLAAVEERLPALQTQVISAEYMATLLEPVAVSALQARVDDLLAAASLPRQRRGKPYDLRPLIEALSLVTDSSPEGNRKSSGLRSEAEQPAQFSDFHAPSAPRFLGREGGRGVERGVPSALEPFREGARARIFMRLAARQGATGRPEEVLDALGIPLEVARLERTRLILQNGIE